ncbi:hypothetical protein DXG01_012144 [Tephrocybe rancida]|nr:hypothetical protein DXG01_012144 [Tephrocybe rancida]
MNTRPEWLKARAHSAPLPSSRPSRSRSRNMSRVATAIDKYRIQVKKQEAIEKLRALARASSDEQSSRPQFLTPRVEIIDDVNQGRVIVKLELPDINPSDVQLKLHGTLLSVHGERLPDLSAVSEEYRDGLKLHSTATMAGNHRPNVLIFGGGKVASFLSNQIHISPKQKQLPSQPLPPLPPGRVRAERVHYNELRYGAFCRNLRVPQGTTASDIDGKFMNGMLVLSWPRTIPTIQAEKSPKEEEIDISIPFAPATPFSVKVESVDSIEVDSQ